MDTVKIGQLWRDKDKRRPKEGIIQDIITADSGDKVLVQLNNGTETEYKLDRFVKRWEMIGEPTGLEVVELEPEAVADKPKHKTREQWLEAAVKLLKAKVFKGLTYEKKGEPEPIAVTIPEVRVSVGWPGGRGPKAKTIGQCWKSHVAADKVIQVFISPVVSKPDEVLAVLTHELIHASDDGASGHRGHFSKVAKKIGFTGKMTETVPGEELKELLKPLAAQLGTYPHGALRQESKPIVQKTYMLKLSASPDCVDCDPAYKIRMTQKWLEEAGAPLCPHGIEMEEE